MWKKFFLFSWFGYDHGMPYCDFMFEHVKPTILKVIQLNFLRSVMLLFKMVLWQILVPMKKKCTCFPRGYNNKYCKWRFQTKTHTSPMISCMCSNNIHGEKSIMRLTPAIRSNFSSTKRFKFFCWKFEFRNRTFTNGFAMLENPRIHAKVH